MELIKLLQIEGISEATQEDIILNFLECIDDESALAIVEEYEQAEMSLTESIINEVSLGYALKKSLGGAVQRFKDIRKKQANVSTDRPIGLAGIRKQEAQKQDVVKSQERFKQAKDTAKDIVNRMFNTRYVRDNKVAKAPEVKTETTQVSKPEAKTETAQPANPSTTQTAEPAKTKTTKPANQTAEPTKTTKPVVQTAEPATQTAEPATQTAEPESKKDKQLVAVGAPSEEQTEEGKANIIKRYNALKNKKNLTSGELKLKQTMEDKYDFLS